DRHFPWVPQQVFDDGARTYIHLPREAAHKELPVLTVLDGGKEVLVNYAVHGDYYVADRTFDRAALLLGDRRPVIGRRRWPLPPSRKASPPCPTHPRARRLSARPIRPPRAGSTRLRSSS